MGQQIRKITDLMVYKLAFKLAQEIFDLTKSFPRDEAYSLTDQIRRSARSVAVNIREGFAKRRYEQIIVRQLVDASGSSEETRGWLEFAKSCAYISDSKYQELDGRYDELNAMLYRLTNNWKKRPAVSLTSDF